jgi:NDP-sugar pyrophosphorylase family protein
LRSFGIEDIAINVHYLADRIVQTFGDGSQYGVKLHYLHESVLLGSAGGVKQMEEFLKDDTFVVIGCDEVTDMRLDALVAFHKQRAAIATIGLVEADDVSHYGVVIVDDDGRILDFQEKPPPGTERSNLVNTGVYIFEPAIFDRIPAARTSFPACNTMRRRFTVYGCKARIGATSARPTNTVSPRVMCWKGVSGYSATHALAATHRTRYWATTSASKATFGSARSHGLATACASSVRR